MPKAQLKALPLSSVDLVSLLDKDYPPRCIGTDESVESAHRYAGMRELVERLLILRDREAKRQLENKINV